MKKRFLSFLLTLTLVALTLAACSPQPGPEEGLKDFLESVKTGNFVSEEFAKMEDEEIPPEFKEGLEKTTNEFTYEIGDVKEDGDNATVKLTVKTKDYGESFKVALGGVLEKYLEEIMTRELGGEDVPEEEIDAMSLKLFGQAITNAVEQADKEYVKELDVKMEKEDGKWIPDEDSEYNIVNACSGGLFDAFENIDETIS